MYITLHHCNEKSPNVIHFAERMSERSLDGCLKLADCLSASLFLLYRSSHTPQAGNLVAWARNLIPVSQSDDSGVNLPAAVFTCWPSFQPAEGCGRCELWYDVVLVLGSWWFSRDWIMRAASGWGEWWCHKGSPGSTVKPLKDIAVLIGLAETQTGIGHLLGVYQEGCLMFVQALTHDYLGFVAFEWYLTSTSQQGRCWHKAIWGITWQDKGATHVIFSHTKTEKLHNYETEF